VPAYSAYIARINGLLNERRGNGIDSLNKESTEIDYDNQQIKHSSLCIYRED
jgi:hypothetical protein